MTKLLILSDSHNSAGAVERILHAESDANAVVFLGDGLRDLEEALTLHPKMKVYAVAGNCDFGALEPLDGLAAFDQVVVEVGYFGQVARAPVCLAAYVKLLRGE